MTNFIANLMTNLYDILECQVSEPSSEPHGGGRSRMSFTMSSRMSFTMSFYNVILYDIQTCQVSEPSNKPRGGVLCKHHDKHHGQHHILRTVT